MDKQKAKKIIKTTVMSALAALILLYISLGKIYQNEKPFEDLSSSEVTLFQSIDEETKLALVGIPQDSLLAHTEDLDSLSAVLAQVPPASYDSMQKTMKNNSDLAYALFAGVRFILILFLSIVLYLKFIGPLSYAISFQKGLFEGTKLVLLFGIFLAIATTINQFIFSGIPRLDVLFSGLFTQMIKMLKIGLIYSVVIAAFLWFHPQNQLRLQKVAERENKKRS